MNNPDILLTADTHQKITDFVRQRLHARHVVIHSHVQALWGGQGHIIRLKTDVPDCKSVIVKFIAPSDSASHPRGWNTSRSFTRKTQSYAVEAAWYSRFAARCGQRCKVPTLLGLQEDENTRLFLLEDLAVKFPASPARLTVKQVSVCLDWLAAFHAQFLFDAGEGLWPQGCYWHLQTREDEWHAMKDSPVKKAATWLDNQLLSARFQTLVHGDAKLANFCFSNNLSRVAAVDFQYVGRGCGMSDVAYLLGSCLTEDDCHAHDKALLEIYFTALRQALSMQTEHDPPGQTNPISADPQLLADELINEWRGLYAVAWTDFYRFLLGWMPQHTKINSYTEKQAEEALSGWAGS
ncbi:MAG: phosphotransferase family protein [Granulosicoccus sp.]